jgi:integrase
MRHLQALLNWCYDMEFLDRIIRLKKAEIPDKEMETYDEADLDKLEKHLLALYNNADGDARTRRRNQNLYRAFLLARHTLLRSGAIWALELDTIDLQGRLIRVRETEVRIRKRSGVVKEPYRPKKMKFPNKPINDTLFEFLELDLPTRSEKEKYFLDDGHGCAWRMQSGKMAGVLKTEIKLIGLNSDLKPFHEGLRASGITWLLNQPGVSPQMVQQLADHSDIQTTMGYYNTRKASQKTTVDLLSRGRVES